MGEIEREEVRLKDDTDPFNGRSVRCQSGQESSSGVNSLVKP